MIKSWFYRKTNDFYYCPICEDVFGRVYSTGRFPCLHCGEFMKNKKQYRLRDWVERTLDVLCLAFLLTLPLVCYYALVESYTNGGDIKKIFKRIFS